MHSDLFKEIHSERCVSFEIPIKVDAQVFQRISSQEHFGSLQEDSSIMCEKQIDAIREGPDDSATLIKGRAAALSSFEDRKDTTQDIINCGFEPSED